MPPSVLGGDEHRVNVGERAPIVIGEVVQVEGHRDAAAGASARKARSAGWPP